MFRLIKPSPELISRIEKNLVEPNYYNDVKTNIRFRDIYKKVGDTAETLSQIALGISAIVAFSAGFFSINILSFIAGCLGTISIVLSKFSSYSLKESKERTDQVNIILSQLGIENIPDIIVDNQPVRVNSNQIMEI
jgi:hypothetical protein